MSDEPLFFGDKFKKVVNPAKILPSLLQKQGEKKKLK